MDKLTCIPAEAVAIDGVTPEVGDTVNYQAEGRVERVEGGKLYVRATTANGKPILEDEAGEEMGEMEETDEGMRKQAKALDAEEGML
jgi:hypothetical protein